MSLVCALLVLVLLLLLYWLLSISQAVLDRALPSLPCRQLLRLKRVKHSTPSTWV
jgi:hypothetical protein